jgi:pentatricopeptide repeat protein
VSRAEKYFVAMLDANIRLTTVACNYVIQACARADRVEIAEQYISYMDCNGVALDTITLNSMMNACASRGDLNRAHFWFDRIVARGIKPNVITYGTICKILARHGEATKIEGMLASLEGSGVALNEYFYASLISACLFSVPMDLVRAEGAVREMTVRGFSIRRVRHPLRKALGKEHSEELLARAGKSSGQRQPRSVEQRSYSHRCASIGTCQPQADRRRVVRKNRGGCGDYGHNDAE